VKKKKPNTRGSLHPAHNTAEAHYQLGRTLLAKGQPDDALASYLKAIEMDPHFAAAYHGAGNVYHAKRQLDDALTCFQKAIELKPDVAVPYNNIANVLVEKGQFEQAIIHYHKALELQPDSPATYGNLAVAYYGLGHTLEGKNRFDDAVNAYRQALQLNPQLKEAYHDLGMLFLKQERLDEALTCFNKLTELDPRNAYAYNAMGTVFQKKGDLDKAETYYLQALQVSPGLPEAYNNLGTIYKDRGLPDDAMIYYQKALQINPRFPEAYNNLGTLYRDKGQLIDAVSNYRRAIDLNFDFAEAHWNLAYALLLSGDLRKGWREYEWRWKVQDHYLHDLTQPLWDGTDITGHTILLHAEQGIGDTIQCIRYAPLAAACGVRVIVACQKEIARLLKNVEGVDMVVPYGEPLPAFDLHCPLLRLPLVFETALENIPAKIPYIIADSSLVTAWKDKINKVGGKLRIGLAWAGRPTHLNDRNRSLAVSLFSPLAKLETVSLYSLQKGEAALEAKNPPGNMHLTDFTNEIKDFSDTAALIENLDLVISADTAVAHLAGAMGKPVWLLLPFAPDWRWLLDRSDSPWYPTMRLFRQPSPGDWESVIDMISDALRLEVSRWKSQH